MHYLLSKFDRNTVLELMPDLVHCAVLELRESTAHLILLMEMFSGMDDLEYVAIHHKLPSLYADKTTTERRYTFLAGVAAVCKKHGLVDKYFRLIETFRDE